jgi:glyoxylase-like metal-dependent hydrolase (beta-lactamase superfamily II)
MHFIVRGFIRFAALLLLAAAGPALANPKMYVFDCGLLSFTDISNFGLSNEESEVRELFVPCYLIENDGKHLFWDGGLPVGLAGLEPQVNEAGMGMSYKRSVLDQLADIGVTPGDVEFAAYSHFHFDHVGAANAFAASTLLINEREWDAAFLRAEEYPIFDKNLYAELENSPKVLLSEDHDVFGDGTVIIVAAPGHTPGHQVLLVNLQNTGPVVLSGDLYHFEFNRRMRRIPIFNTDKDQTLASMEKVDALLKSSGAQLWIEHNKAFADTLRKAPEYYD